MIAADSCDVHIVAAIVVVVANCHAHAVNFDIETAAARDVGEGSVAVVAIESGGGATAVRNPVAAVDEQDIGVAIAIGIEECHARTHGFRQPFLAGASGVMCKVNPCRGGYVRELDRRSGSVSGLRRELGDHRRRHCEQRNQ